MTYLQMITRLAAMDNPDSVTVIYLAAMDEYFIMDKELYSVVDALKEKE